MPTRKFKNFDAALKKSRAKGFGLLSNADGIDDARDNNYAETWNNAAGTATVEGVRVGRDNAVMLGGSAVVQPTLRPLIFNAVANAGVATRPFHIFTSNAYGKIVKIEEVHGTAGNHASAVTGHITKERGTQSAGSGVSVMSGTFNLKGTADTRQQATLVSNEDYLKFQPGDRLSFKLTGTATNVANLLVIVWVQYESNIFETSVYAATPADQVFFLANRKYAINAISYMHGTAETTTTGLNVELKVQDGTETEAQGTDILTNNSNAGFDALAAANTVQVGTFSALSLVAGERLSMTLDDTRTELANVVMTVAFNAQPGRIEVSKFDPAPAATDHGFFMSDRNSYRLFDGRQIHGTAAGGASTMQLEKCTGTTAAGSGTNLLSTAWDLNATADTVQILDPITVKATVQLDDGDRLAHDFANAIQSTTNFAATYSLIAE